MSNRVIQTPFRIQGMEFEPPFSGKAKLAAEVNLSLAVLLGAAGNMFRQIQVDENGCMKVVSGETTGSFADMVTAISDLQAAMEDIADTDGTLYSMLDAGLGNIYGIATNIGGDTSALASAIANTNNLLDSINTSLGTIGGYLAAVEAAVTDCYDSSAHKFKVSTS